jgi:hypothetical protein
VIYKQQKFITALKTGKPKIKSLPASLSSRIWFIGGTFTHVFGRWALFYEGIGLMDEATLHDCFTS